MEFELKSGGRVIACGGGQSKDPTTASIYAEWHAGKRVERMMGIRSSEFIGMKVRRKVTFFNGRFWSDRSYAK
jgi:hypothetical protein